MELSCYYWNQTPKEIALVKRIVLLHGMGGTGALWRPIAAALENEMHVLAPDQRGHGKSPRPKSGYSPLDYGQDLIDTLSANIFYPTWILGHSMGVRTAVAAAHLKPEWVQGLILIDLGFSGAAGGGLGENLAQFLQKLPTDFESREKAKLFMDTYCPDPAIAQYLLAVSMRDSQGKISFPFSHDALIQTIHHAQGSTLRPWLSELAQKGIPILVLRGKRSLVWKNEEFENEKSIFSMNKTIQFMEIPNAGHGLPFEQRIVMTTLIKDFMRSGDKDHLN